MADRFGFQIYNLRFTVYNLEHWNFGTLELWNFGTLELLFLPEQTIHELHPVEYLQVLNFLTQTDIFHGYFKLV